MDRLGISWQYPWRYPEISKWYPIISQIDIQKISKRYPNVWISMDIYGYLWISMDIYGYLWIPMDIFMGRTPRCFEKFVVCRIFLRPMTRISFMETLRISHKKSCPRRHYNPWWTRISLCYSTELCEWSDAAFSQFIPLLTISAESAYPPTQVVYTCFSF